jgi:hypothetical protein
MKILVLLFVVSSCATYAPRSYKQECGVKGMVLTGVTSDSGSFNSYAGGRGNYSSDGVQCVVPSNEFQECQARIYGQASRPVDEYNEWYGTKRFVTGLGYYALIVPGIAAKLFFDHQRDKAVQESYELEDKLSGQCIENRVPANSN